MAEHIFIPNFSGCYVLVDIRTGLVDTKSMLVRDSRFTEQVWERQKTKYRKEYAHLVKLGTHEIRKVTVAFLPEPDEEQKNVIK